MLSPIKTRISEKLTDKKYRHAFFKGRSEIEIAYDLRRFRKERGLNQSELAQLCGMKQSAISRIEQASYSKWNLSTLWRIADALDVRVRVSIDDMNCAISEYRTKELLEQAIYDANEIVKPSILHDQVATFRAEFDALTLTVSMPVRSLTYVNTSGYSGSTTNSGTSPTEHHTNPKSSGFVLQSLSPCNF